MSVQEMSRGEPAVDTYIQTLMISLCQEKRLRTTLRTGHSRHGAGLRAGGSTAAMKRPAGSTRICAGARAETAQISIAAVVAMRGSASVDWWPRAGCAVDWWPRARYKRPSIAAVVRMRGSAGVD
jgi:hypothetical protein